MHRAFSLIELLVALTILAVVAAMIAPRFFNVQNQARQLAVGENMEEINAAYTRWVSLGGSLNWINIGGNGANGVPLNDASSVCYFLGYLFSQRNDGARASYGDIVDSTGPYGSWTVSLDSTVVQCDVSNMAGNGDPQGPSGVSSPDGIYFDGRNCIYKSGNCAYTIFFEPAALGSNIKTGFWLDYDNPQILQ